MAALKGTPNAFRPVFTQVVKKEPKPRTCLAPVKRKGFTGACLRMQQEPRMSQERQQLLAVIVSAATCLPGGKTLLVLTDPARKRRTHPWLHIPSHVSPSACITTDAARLLADTSQHPPGGIHVLVELVVPVVAVKGPRQNLPELYVGEEAYTVRWAVHTVC